MCHVTPGHRVPRLDVRATDHLTRLCCPAVHAGQGNGRGARTASLAGWRIAGRASTHARTEREGRHQGGGARQGRAQASEWVLILVGAGGTNPRDALPDPAGRHHIRGSGAAGLEACRSGHQGSRDQPS